MSPQEYDALLERAMADTGTCRFGPDTHPTAHPADLKFTVLIDGAEDWEDLTEQEILDRCGTYSDGTLCTPFTHTSQFDFWYEDVAPVAKEPDRHRNADGDAICARCSVRLLRVEDATGQLCHRCRKEETQP